MPIKLPVGEGLNDVRRENRLSVAKSLARVVSEDTCDDDGALTFAKELDREVEEDLGRRSVMRQIDVGDDAQEARQSALYARHPDCQHVAMIVDFVMVDRRA